MPKTKSIFVCKECGHQSVRWQGKCPECDGWNTFSEEEQISENMQGHGSCLSRDDYRTEQPRPLKDIELKDSHRYQVGINEFDRVLGGGLVEGSVVLLAGQPGIGKSTLLLQASNSLSRNPRVNKVLYICGEESTSQAKLRASRLAGFDSSNMLIASETNLDVILEHIKNISPQVTIIDSVQVLYDPSVSSAPGSVSQVRECAAKLTYTAKKLGMALFLVGHVTKEGAVAGPRILEHMVDTVLYFEGERVTSFRVLRAIKNRFGSTNEIGIFEMTDKGLSEVENPSHFFLQEKPKDICGFCVTSSIEGTRPILVEVQALLTLTNFGMPRRQASGFDYNRLNLLVAVLEKRAGLQLANCDIYLNVAGGIDLDEPASDLAVALAVASNFKNKALRPGMVAFGEIGLGGEIKAVTCAKQRIDEASRLGFREIIIPKANLSGIENKSKAVLTGVDTLNEALNAGF